MKKCSKCKPHNMSYLRFHEYSRMAHKKDFRQIKCPGCGLWTWPEHMKPSADRIELLTKEEASE